MMMLAQIGDPTAQQPSLVMDAPPPVFAELGDLRAQTPAVANAPVLLVPASKRLVIAQPTSKLAILKGQTFTVEGRARRVRVSLDALNAPQPITLNLEQWKEVVAEAEEDDED